MVEILHKVSYLRAKARRTWLTKRKIKCVNPLWPPGASQPHSEIVNINPQQAVSVFNIQCSAPHYRLLRRFWKSACWYGPTCAASPLYTVASHLLSPPSHRILRLLLQHLLLRRSSVLWCDSRPVMFVPGVQCWLGGVSVHWGPWDALALRRGIRVSEGDLFPCGAGAGVAVWQVGQQVAAKGRRWFSHRESEWGRSTASYSLTLKVKMIN